ncbi:hypothetical protein [Streptomyces sp. L2]|uniref:hypothetical protein n=1 Tax=Streptomyces sp. L2 TaxID=2162665 RepID=UPI0010135790|nr:hypothetical protein [Streptomyces sp. L2]
MSTIVLIEVARPAEVVRVEQLRHCVTTGETRPATATAAAAAVQHAPVEFDEARRVATAERVPVAWPATPGRGAGIFLHVNGSGATAGCVSVPRATMGRIMGWITPSAHPRIAIG